MATRSAEQPWCPFPQQHPLALPRGSVTAPRHCGRCSSSGVSLVLPPCVLLLLLLRRSLALSVIIVETVQTNHPSTNCQSSCQRALKKIQKKPSVFECLGYDGKITMLCSFKSDQHDDWQILSRSTSSSQKWEINASNRSYKTTCSVFLVKMSFSMTCKPFICIVSLDCGWWFERYHLKESYLQAWSNFRHYTFFCHSCMSK